MALLLAFGTGAFAQYPAKPIRLVVPFPAGESVDATARLVGQSWSAALGQQILVDNRGGAGGTIGGSGLHLIAELFKSVAGIQIVHVPYKDVAQALPEMMSGKVQIAFNTIPAFLPHVKAGRLKALAITASACSPLLPDVPVMTEAGLAGVQGGSWHAVVAPAGTPRAIIERLNQTLVATISVSELRNQLLNQGAQPVGGSPEELRKFMQTEGEKWGRVIQSSGARAD